MPRVEVRLHPLGGVTPFEIAVPQAEAVELGAIGVVEQRQVAVDVGRVEQPRFELAQRAHQ